jgi:hypothetical protein
MSEISHHTFPFFIDHNLGSKSVLFANTCYIIYTADVKWLIKKQLLKPRNQSHDDLMLSEKLVAFSEQFRAQGAGINVFLKKKYIFGLYRLIAHVHFFQYTKVTKYNAIRRT